MIISSVISCLSVFANVHTEPEPFRDVYVSGRPAGRESGRVTITVNYGGSSRKL